MPIAACNQPHRCPKRIAQSIGLALLASSALAPACLGQPTASAPKFEVVSIKPCPNIPAGRGGRGGNSGSPGSLRLNCSTVKDLIRDAYDLLADGHMWRGIVTRSSRTVPIEHGPSWIESDHYSIDAKPDSPQTQEMMQGPMMRTLLEDRFKLKIHREMREGLVYTLTLAKGGIKATREPGNCIGIEDVDFRKLGPGEKPPLICDSAMVSSGKLDFRAMSIGAFCQNLTWNVLDRPVIDRTGLAGRFNFHLEFTPDEATPSLTPNPLGGTPTEPGPSIFTAIQELGFKLEGGKGPVPHLIIDHIERPESN